MRNKTVCWDQDDDPEGNVQHIAVHRLTPKEVEHVLLHPTGRETSRASKLPVVFGETPSGGYMMVAYEEIGSSRIYPVTAYEVPRPK